MRKYQAALLAISMIFIGSGYALAQEQLDESYEIKGGESPENAEENMYDTRDYQEDYGEPAEVPDSEEWGREEKQKPVKGGWGGKDGQSATGGEEMSISGDAPKKVIVQEGDTLWDLCATHLGNPWYWQKVWAMNKHIANPHWIYPGNVIYFNETPGTGTMVSAEGENDPAQNEEESAGTDELGHIPDILDEQEWGEVGDGGKYRLKDYFTTVSGMGYDFYNFRRDGFIAYKELQYTGRITNSPEENILLVEGNLIYIKPEGKMDFKVGKTYQIFRQGAKVRHPATGDKLGVKVEILGQCEVIRLSSKNVATARITQSYSEIERGDLVRPWNDPVRDIRPRRNKVSLQGYVVARMGDNDIITEQQIVYLDKGVSHGIEEGNRLFVIRKLDYEPNSHSLDKDDLPFEKIGELVVLSAGHQTSVAMVSTSLIGIEVGDKIVMEKNY